MEFGYSRPSWLMQSECCIQENCEVPEFGDNIQNTTEFISVTFLFFSLLSGYSWYRILDWRGIPVKREMGFLSWFFSPPFWPQHSYHMAEVSWGWSSCDFCFPSEAYCCFHCSRFHKTQCVSKCLEAVQYDSSIWLCKDRISKKKKKQKKKKKTKIRRVHFSLLFSLISIAKSPGESILILNWRIRFRFHSSPK